MLDCECYTSLLSAEKWGWDCTSWAKSGVYNYFVTVVIIHVSLSFVCTGACRPL